MRLASNRDAVPLPHGNRPATLSADKRIGSHCALFVKRQRGNVNSQARALASGMGRSRIGWALSVAAPWCVALAVLVSITAEAEQEPAEFTSAFARSQLISAPGRLDRAIRLPRGPCARWTKTASRCRSFRPAMWSAIRDDLAAQFRRERAERGAEAAGRDVSRRRSPRQGRSARRRSRASTPDA